MKCPALHILVLFIYLSTQMGCASSHKRSLTQPISKTNFDPDYTYNIQLKHTDTNLEVKGSHLQSHGDFLIVKTANGDLAARHHVKDIKKIEGQSKKRVGSYALPAMGIGAAAGALVGGLGSALGSKCSGSSEPSDCDSLTPLVIGVSVLGAGVVGGLIGLGIGFAIPKKAKVTITPTVTRNANETAAGIGLTMPF